ncbi:hypothetical protein Tco_1522909 [Tanacetum coccineum]
MEHLGPEVLKLLMDWLCIKHNLIILEEKQEGNNKSLCCSSGCEYVGPHYTKDCPLKEEGKTLEEAYYTQLGAPYSYVFSFIEDIAVVLCLELFQSTAPPFITKTKPVLRSKGPRLVLQLRSQSSDFRLDSVSIYSLGSEDLLYRIGFDIYFDIGLWSPEITDVPDATALFFFNFAIYSVRDPLCWSCLVLLVNFVPKQDVFLAGDLMLGVISQIALALALALASFISLALCLRFSSGASKIALPLLQHEMP